MQGAFHDAPGHITLRLYAEFVLAARRDMGDSSSQATPADVLGLRLNDLYKDPKIRLIAELPFDELCREYDWSIPWG